MQEWPNLVHGTNMGTKEKYLVDVVKCFLFISVIKIHSNHCFQNSKSALAYL